jgi:FkbM family methyltransferase
VEAEKHNHRVALRNTQLNGITNVSVILAAVGAEEGSVRFAEGLNGHVLSRGAAASARVPGITIDALVDRHGPPDVVFIDVEGYEVEALRGAQRCIAAGDTDFFVETHIGHGLEDAGGTVHDVLNYFPDPRFRRLVSPARGEWEGYSFTKLDTTDPPRERFFLVALARSARGPTSTVRASGR